MLFWFASNFASYKILQYATTPLIPKPISPLLLSASWSIGKSPDRYTALTRHTKNSLKPRPTNSAADLSVCFSSCLPSGSRPCVEDFDVAPRRAVCPMQKPSENPAIPSLGSCNPARIARKRHTTSWWRRNKLLLGWRGDQLNSTAELPS